MEQSVTVLLPYETHRESVGRQEGLTMPSEAEPVTKRRTAKAKKQTECAHCEAVFIPYRKTALYCSNNCRLLAYQARERERVRVERRRLEKNQRRRDLNRLRRRYATLEDSLQHALAQHSRALDAEYDGYGDPDRTSRALNSVSRVRGRVDTQRRKLREEAKALGFDPDIFEKQEPGRRPQ